jgi:hypothetical protein
LRPREKLGIFAIGVLVLLLLSGIEEGLWALASLLLYGPYFIMAAMIGIFVWSFKDRFEGRTAESLSSYQTSVERLPIRRSERLSAWAWSRPIALLIGTVELLYIAVSSWQTVVGYVCDGRLCGYTPVLTFSNAVILVIVALALIFLRQAFVDFRYIREVRRSL